MALLFVFGTHQKQTMNVQEQLKKIHVYVNECDNVVSNVVLCNNTYIECDDALCVEMDEPFYEILVSTDEDSVELVYVSNDSYYDYRENKFFKLSDVELIRKIINTISASVVSDDK